MDVELVNTYLESLVKERPPLIHEMEQYANEHHVPIMELVGIEAILQILRIAQPKKILEIGTAIGYSAIRMALTLPHAEIVTVERHKQRYDTALDFVKKSGRSKQIDILFGNALELEEQVKHRGPFDLLFIDAAKGQYKRFFEMYSPMLSQDTIIITDNVLYKGFVASKIDTENKRTNQLISKIRNYNEWLMKNPLYDTTILPVGDGMAISKRRGD
ncbi:O-methyltransferase [Cytobacillus sp. IB215665]|uniref:O-methyltransferase n=1 Tax=Cytobacillus sp. IB215665 TaxID=3097357 RepID=UPI002A165D47|nr:O-methyltransferase [Cytobacillus sp. IB215665]MDX8364114.1 O-methyltransferase [Cytobacillus sp. IB215665]